MGWEQNAVEAGDATAHPRKFFGGQNRLDLSKIKILCPPNIRSSTAMDERCMKNMQLQSSTKTIKPYLNFHGYIRHETWVNPKVIETNSYRFKPVLIQAILKL